VFELTANKRARGKRKERLNTENYGFAHTSGIAVCTKIVEAFPKHLLYCDKNTNKKTK